MLFKIFMSALMVCFSFSAIALTGSDTSAATPLETISPSLQSVSSVSDKSLSADFSEAMLAPGSAAPGNYTISGLGAGTLVPTPASVSGGPTTFTLDWAAGEMRDSVALTLTAAGVQDTVGNPINPVANNASCPGMGTVPVFSDLTVMPTEAASGDTVTISVSVSETLQVDPEVTINGHPATPPYGKAEGYIFEYEVQESDPLGMAAIEISGVDLAGNIGTLSNTSLLEIVEAEPGLPMWGWPWVAALLLVLGMVVLWRRRFGGTRVWTEWTVWTARTGGTNGLSTDRSPFEGGGAKRRGMFFFFVALTLACSWAFAQAPTVSNVTMTQSPNATSTQVDIYYDLDAPNGPCVITVSLSKDGGADGYIHPVTSVTGDIAEVTTGTGKHIVWDIRADYPEEDLPEARLQVTADDGVEVPEVSSFSINAGTVTTADPVVTLDNATDNRATEYMASEASDFSGATWQPYDTAPTFTLSSKEGGTKTVYFKVRNAAGESAAVSDTIELTGRTITLPGDVPLELVWLPSGSYQMGRYPGEPDSVSSEDPQHEVTLAYGFWMGKYEVTQQQWLAVRGAWPGTAPSSGWGLGNAYPAYNISWDDVQDFNTSLNAHIVSSGQGPLTVRLPSEAEWEYACRAGTQTRFYWGDDPGYTEIGAYAWYSTGATNPVGGKTANDLGLFDMSGNVFEWCEDDYHDGYAGAPADGSAWIDVPRAAIRIVRGGSWGSEASYCRSAFRSGYTAGGRGTNFGFRLSAITPPEVTSFAINGGAASTSDPVVTLNNTAMNSPAEYMASEASDFSGATWLPYDTAPAFNLSFGVGTRTVYFKVRKSGREVATVVSDTIFLAPNTVGVNTGMFTMGRTTSGDDAVYGSTNEDPQHEVMLGTYQLGKGEVTNKEYCDVLNWALAQGYLYADTAGTPWSGSGDIYAGGTAGSRYLAVGFSSGYCNIHYSDGVFTSKTRVGLPDTTNYSMDTHPMVMVSWYGSVAFCNWLSEWQGLTPCYDMNSLGWPLMVATPTPGGYRLPTEAEWERAAAWDSASGGRHWIYSFLSDTLAGKERANYMDDAPGYVNPLGLTTSPYTSPVMWFDGVNVSPNGSVATVNSPSPVGAYDMSGNVIEWCHDWYLATYYSGGSMTNPLGPATGTGRVLRGGNYGFSFSTLRSARRIMTTPTLTNGSIGFRLAKSEPSVGTTSFVINNGDATATLPTVTLNNTCWGTPTEYMASEASDFSGATWQPYDAAPSFTLSSAEGGTKTVYFKVRNAEYESAPVSDTIDLTARTVTLPGDVPLELVWVPSGSFQMGRYPGEADSFDWEDPQHPVTLAYGFWMGKYEITQQQWLAVRGAWPGETPSVQPSAMYGLGNSYPAYYLSWNDAKDFITALNAHIVSSGQGPLTVRLPSEAEWEYACRAGTTTRFYCGDAPGCDGFCSDCAAGTLPGNLGDYLWYCGNDSPVGSKPVGGKLPNALGLYDMHGNAREWCEDDTHYDYLGAPVDGGPWLESPRTAYRILRGGWAGELITFSRSACRGSYPTDVRDMDTGFRLAALPTRVLTLAVNGGAATTTDLPVTLDNTATNSPVEYMASEAPDFSGATWQPYGTAPSFTLSYGVGARTVYFKVRDAGGEVFNVCSDTIFITPNTVPVDAGTFTMGRLDSGTNDDVTYGATYELPRHEVTLGAYQLGKYEVTCKEYCDVLNWAKAKGYLYADAAGTPWSGSGDIYAGGTATSRYLAVKLTGTDCDIRLWAGLFTPKTRVGLPGTTNYAMDTHPMEQLSWYGSVAFCNWLSEWQGLTPCYDMNSEFWPLTIVPPMPGGYRLPTEAEWERAAGWDAAGGGRHWIYSFLSDTLTGKDRANYFESSVGHVNPLGLTTTPRTSPVGWFNGVNVSPNGSVATVDSPSPVGAYDMSGNVQEWCHDWYADNYSDGPMTDPTGPATGSNRIVRGGFWNSTISYCRSAGRVSYTPTTASPVFGFRLARSEP